MSRSMPKICVALRECPSARCATFFYEHFGIAPHRYLMIARLNRVRAAIREAGPGERSRASARTPGSGISAGSPISTASCSESCPRSTSPSTDRFRVVSLSRAARLAHEGHAGILPEQVAL